MNEYDLYNKEITPEASYHFIKKHNLYVSRAVEANSYASQNCMRMSNRYEKCMYNMSENGAIPMWKKSLSQAQTANAFSWMMIKTAIDEKKQGWRYIEDGNKYIEHVTDLGSKFTQEQRDKISMIRYYGQLYSSALHKKYFKSFTDGNLQYWYMKLKDLDKEADKNEVKS